MSLPLGLRCDGFSVGLALQVVQKSTGLEVIRGLFLSVYPGHTFEGLLTLGLE